jgi:drug/metabolite transporter (DMT)-like permease
VSAYEAQGWSDFGVAVAGAGAALAGLLFVALPINLNRILAGYRLTARAGSTLIMLSAPLVLLIPDQNDIALGWEDGVVRRALLAAGRGHRGLDAGTRDAWVLLVETLR